MANTTRHTPARTIKAHIFYGPRHWTVVLFDRRGHCEVHCDFDSFADVLVCLPVLWRRDDQ